MANVLPYLSSLIPSVSSSSSSSSSVCTALALVSVLVGLVAMSPSEKAISGEQRARLFDKCRPHLPPPHSTNGTDIVLDDEHGFVFVDNVKAASTTVREILDMAGFDWCMQRHGQPKMANLAVDHRQCGSCFSCKCSRFTSSCLTSRSLEGKYLFGFVRDPVEKFESGVRQGWFQDPDGLASLSADEILDKQLAMAQGRWLNEHLQPSTHRYNVMSGKDSLFPSLDFIGSTETFAADWPRVVAELRRRGMRETAEMRKLARVKANTREEDPKSKLSDQGIKKMCASALYKHEWECFGYQKPDVCL